MTRAHGDVMKLRFSPLQWATSAFVCGTAFALAACAPEFDQSRDASATRGTLGAEVFTALCDRVGAGELREDLTGASFRALCHDEGAGFGDSVDTSLLPPLTGDAKNDKGETVTLAATPA